MDKNKFKDHDFSKDFEKTLAIDLAKEFAERRQNATRANSYFAESFNVNSEKFKKEARWKHFRFSILYLIAFMMFAVMIASWFIPSHTIVSGIDGGSDLINNGTAKLGLFDLFISISTAFTDSGMMIWFILATAGFMGVFIRTGAIQSMIKYVVEHEKITPRRMLITVMLIISSLSLLFNAKYLIISMAVVVVPLFVFKGYDVITPILALMLGTAAGISSSLFVNDLLENWNYNIASAVGALPSELSTSTGGWIRLIVWVVLTLAAIVIVDNYGNKVISDQKRSLAKFETEKLLETESNILMTADREKMTKKKKAIISTLAITIIIIIIGVLPLHEVGFTLFYDASINWSNNDFIRVIWGSSMGAIGTWGKTEISALFIFATILIGFISLAGQQVIIKGFTRGMGSTTKLIMVLILAGALYQTFIASGIHVRIINNVFTYFTVTSNNFTGIGIFFSTMITSIFVPILEHSSYLYGNAIGTITQGSDLSIEYLTFLGTAVSAGSSALHAILPTSAVLMGTIWAYKLGYKQWLKAVWKHVVVFAMVSMSLIAFISFYLLNLK